MPKEKENSRTRSKHKSKFKPPKQITERYLHNAGLFYLERFPASTAHFRTVMLRKIRRSCAYHKDQDIESCTAMLDALIIRFVDLGLLNDQAYLTGMVTSLRRRGLAARHIEMKLVQKGLSRDDVQQAIETFDMDHFDDGAGDLHAAVIFARKKRLGPFDKTQRYTADKALAAIARSGFNYDICSRILALSFDEATALIAETKL